MDVLTGRLLLHPVDHARSLHFYRDVLGLAVAREFGPPEARGTVFFIGGGLLELSGSGEPGAPAGFALWLQVRDVAAEHARLLTAGATIRREPRTEPWGLIECWVADPDGVPIVLVEVPAAHPLRRDTRAVSATG